VEVEFLGSKAEEVAVGDEAFAFRAVVILTEMRQGSPIEAKRNTFTLDILLAATSHDL